MNQDLPQHIGIIIDGNRRWAKQNKLSVLQGHQKGRENVKKISRYAFERGVKIFTVYAFSTENWKRDKTEVNNLMNLLRFTIVEELDELIEDNIKLKVIGKIEGLDKSLQKDISKAEEKTKNNTAGLLQICINYGGRLEILEAFKKIIKDKINPENVTEELFKKYLWTAGVSDPDLIIRTSGEQRLSGFLTWQSVYSELFFIKKHWPDFNEKDLDKIIEEYQKRNRRFGGN